jgi:hypothetical protein
MSVNEELQGNYRINNKTEFNKVIKAMVAAANKQIDRVNTLVKAYKSATRDRTSINWNLVERYAPSSFDLHDWSLRDKIETAIRQRAKLPKVTKNTLRVSNMRIDYQKQTFSIDVPYDNHTVDTFNSQPAVQAFWTALGHVKWQQRGKKDGGYCQYNCEYQDEPNYQSYHGRVGKDMSDWVDKRPF